MNIKTFNILLGFTLWASFFSFAQQDLFTFKHLTIDNGLSQNTVNCIYQDSKGFMWLGTQDGLNRFDGYSFKTYRNEKNNTNSISNNYIYDIYEDHNNVLWIATFGGGLNSLNLATGKINTYKRNSKDSTSFPSNRLFSIKEFPEGTLWIGSNEGLIKFNKATKKSQLFLSQKTTTNALEDNYIGIVSSDKNGLLWLRSDSGLTRFNTKTKEVSFYNKTPFLNAIVFGDIFDIKNIHDTMILTCSAGLVEINWKDKTDRLLLDATTVFKEETILHLNKILTLKRGYYAIGTNKGLLFFNANDNSVSKYSSVATDLKSLTHNNVLSIHKSRDDVIWIGTRNGLNIIDNQNPDFLHVRYNSEKKGLSSKNVNSFIEENDSSLWVGTTDGLNLFDKERNDFKVFRKDIGNTALKTNYILCLFKDSKDHKWIGTRRNGLYKIEKSKNGKISFRHVKPFTKDLSDTSIHYIAEDKNKFLWLGTGGKGLWKYNPLNNIAKTYPTAKDGTGPSHPYIFSILQDSFENIWLGTPTGGLNLFNPKTEKFLYFQNNSENQNSLSNDIVLSIFEDSKHNLWIGTNGGLNKLIPKLEKNMFAKLNAEKVKKNDSLFTIFGQEQGFPNDVIYGMLQDGHENLWISTNYGLVTFNIDEEKVDKKFNISHGLQNNEFNQNGYYKAEDGQFYFGGVNGFNIFHPDSIKGNTYIPPVVLTKLSLYNKPVLVGKKNNEAQFTLEKELPYLDGINLSWKHDVITIDFTTLNYNSPEKNTYRYKLEGFNQDWVYTNDQRSATYTNLAPGDYIFKVQASNSSGLWNNKGAQLSVHISTPPWLSWYAYAFYLIITSLTIYLFLKYRIQRATEKIRIQTEIEKAKVTEREAFRKRSSRDFHDEAGTRVTRIALITELAKLKSKGNEELEEYLSQIENNLQDLNNGMRDFIWALDPSKDNAYDTLNRFTEFAGKFCEYGEIQFKSVAILEELKDVTLNMSERRHLLLILKEALNNSIKHAKPTIIDFSVDVSLPKLVFSLQDNGKGFENHLANKGNGLKNMKERAEAINANLSITSQPNEGTSIKLIVETTQLGNG